MADTWYPGWQATLDDKPVPLLRADGLFKAVQVPAGEHHIILSYRPPSYKIGALLSLIAWLGLGLAAIRIAPYHT